MRDKELVGRYFPKLQDKDVGRVLAKAKKQLGQRKTVKGLINLVNEGMG